MSLMMLIQFDYLKTPLGSLIAVAAMVDDVASLVILVRRAHDCVFFLSFFFLLALFFDFDFVLPRPENTGELIHLLPCQYPALHPATWRGGGTSSEVVSIEAAHSYFIYVMLTCTIHSGGAIH